METIGFRNIKGGGEAFERAKMSLFRFDREPYDPRNVMELNANGGDWPGDTGGRVILALVMLQQSTGIPSRTLPEIMALIPEYVNEKGYFGPVYPEGEFSEQQFSGCGWFLRALCEYYHMTGDGAVLARIRDFAENLYLPARGHYVKYPSTPEERVFEGDAIGENTGHIFNGWHTSTDIGCAFIALDGISAAYEILKTPELRELLAEACDKFIAVDLLKLQFQTHATLSACRGMLRFYECGGGDKYLAEVRRIFTLYLEQGSTENYENWNWFKRGKFTEACAVIDSYILATGLWRATGDPFYLNTAHYIQYNGMDFMQWANGGFSCNLASGAGGGDFVQPRYAREVTWCCTMRGGDGLSREIENLYYSDGEMLTLPFYCDSMASLRYKEGEMLVREVTAYPKEGYVSLEVVSSTVRGFKPVRLFVPEWTDSGAAVLRVDGVPEEFTLKDGFAEFLLPARAGVKAEFTFPVTLRKVPTHNINTEPGLCTYRHGPLILAPDNSAEHADIPAGASFKYWGNANYRLEGTASEFDFVLSPINNRIHLSMSELMKVHRQILFKA